MKKSITGGCKIMQDVEATTKHSMQNGNAKPLLRHDQKQKTGVRRGTRKGEADQKRRNQSS